VLREVSSKYRCWVEDYFKKQWLPGVSVTLLRCQRRGISPLALRYNPLAIVPRSWGPGGHTIFEMIPQDRSKVFIMGHRDPLALMASVPALWTVSIVAKHGFKEKDQGPPTMYATSSYLHYWDTQMKKIGAIRYPGFPKLQKGKIDSQFFQFNHNHTQILTSWRAIMSKVMQAHR
jgi:hypothetical protein